MPGIPPAIAQIILRLQQLSQVRPKDEAEAQGLEMAKQDLMGQMRTRSEYSLRQPGEDLEGGGFTGQIGNPEPVRAPFRTSDYEMPGNFEREQTMANSLANDAALRGALSTQYKFDPEVGVPITYTPANWAHVINSGLSPDVMGQDTVVLEGPPDYRNQLKYRTNPRRWGPGDSKALTENDIKMHAIMLARAARLGSSAAKGAMRILDRAYRSSPHSKKRLMSMFGG